MFNVLTYSVGSYGCGIVSLDIVDMLGVPVMDHCLQDKSTVLNAFRESARANTRRLCIDVLPDIYVLTVWGLMVVVSPLQIL